MKKFTKILILTLILCASLIFAFGCSEESNTPPTEQPKVEAEVHEDSVFKEVYSLNDEIFMNYLLMDIDGSQYRITEGELEYPSGKTYKKTGYELSEVGEYTLSYTAELDGSVKTGVKQFNVFNNYYSLTSEYSNVNFATDASYTVFTSGTYINSSGKEATAWGGGLDTAKASGLKISLAEGDEFKWNKPLKMSNGINDLFNIILPHSTPNRLFTSLTGVPKQADRIIVTLTDCYDSSKKLEFVFDFSRNLGLLCIRVGANGDVASSLNPVNRNADGVDTGYRSENPKTYFFIGEKEYVCIYGTRGSQTNAMQSGGYTLSLNTTTAEVFATTDSMREKGDKLLVNQLNNPDIHEDISKYFYGFTNNEAYLSIKCEDYYDSTCEFILTDILGTSQEELNVDAYVDTVKPFIVVDAPSDIITVITNKEFEIFGAECFDVNLKGDYKVSCYYGYGTANQVSIKIVDDKLTLPLPGKYSLVYTAYDYYGNRTDKVVTLNAKNSGEAISYDRLKLFDVKLGEIIELPQLNPIGLNGKVYVSSSVIDSNGNEVTIDENGKFMCLNAGKYQVKYVMTDNVFVEEFAYEINGLPNSDNVQFLDKLTIEDYLMQGRTYHFDDYYAYTFEKSSPTKNKAEVYAKVDNGSFAKIENYNNYLVTAKKTVKFKFIYNGAEIESEELKVVDVGLNQSNESVNLPGYFVSDGKAVVTKYFDEEFVKIKADADSTVEFINPISFKYFALNFNIPKNSNKFKRLNFILTDFYDATRTITIGFADDGSPMMFVNDKSATLSSLTGKVLSVEYKNKNIQNDTVKLAVDNIFTSDKVLLSIAFEGVTGNSELQLFKINGQSFNVTEDAIYPDMSVYNVSGRYAVGSTITVYKPSLADVLSSINTEETKVTVQNASGQYLKDADGNVLNKFNITEDLQVKFETIGKVYVTYYAEDTAGNQLNKGRGVRYVVDIIDTVAPSITLEKGYGASTIKTAKLNDKVKIAKYTVSDNWCSNDELEVTVRVFTPYNEFLAMDGDTFTTSNKGTYRIVYSCVDTSGNIAEIYYSVNVN